MDVPTTDESRHGLGGNNPPDPIEILRAHLTETYSEMMKRCRDLLDLENRLPATMDDDWEAKLTETIKSCTKFIRSSEVSRLEANDPHRALIAATDGFFKGMSDKVDTLKGKLSKDYLTPYQQDKADRLKREREEAARIAKAKADEEERIAREERERVAEAKRREEAARAEAERVKRVAREAEEKRKADAQAELDRIERERVAAERRETEARTKRAREKAARDKEAADALAAETAARQRREQQAAREKEREDARNAKADVETAVADRREAAASAGVARDRAAVATQERNVTSRAARATTADLSRTRTDLGAVASLRTTWHYEVVNPDEVPRLYLQVDESAIAAAVRAATTPDGKNTLQIAGVRIYPITDSVVR